MREILNQVQDDEWKITADARENDARYFAKYVWIWSNST